MQCEFNISCPKCHKLPPLIISIENSLLLNKFIIKSKCSCSKYQIISQNINDFYIKCIVDKKFSSNNQIWEDSLLAGNNSKPTKETFNETMLDEQNNLNVVYEKITNKLNLLEEIFSKLKQQINKLFSYKESLKNQLQVLYPKLYDDFYISKNTIYTNPMENFKNFIHDTKENSITQHLINILFV